jgi:hypothetical protein
MCFSADAIASGLRASENIASGGGHGPKPPAIVVQSM